MKKPTTRHTSLAEAGQPMPRPRPEPFTVSACANRADERIRILFHKLAQNDDRAVVLDEFFRYFDDGSVRRVRVPAAHTFGSFLREIADTFFLPKGSIDKMRASILKTIEKRSILVVEDLDRLDWDCSANAMLSMGFLREIHDVTGCAIVVEYHPVYEPEEQFARRITFTTRRATVAAAK